MVGWRSQVGTVAAHADGVTGFLERLDELIFVLRQNAGEDRKILEACAVGDRAGRADRSLKPHGMSHDGRCCRRVPRHHHGAHTQGL